MVTKGPQLKTRTAAIIDEIEALSPGAFAAGRQGCDIGEESVSGKMYVETRRMVRDMARANITPTHWVMTEDAWTQLRSEVTPGHPLVKAAGTER